MILLSSVFSHQSSVMNADDRMNLLCGLLLSILLLGGLWLLWRGPKRG
jgi:hypothetical protein